MYMNSDSDPNARSSIYIILKGRRFLRQNVEILVYILWKIKRKQPEKELHSALFSVRDIIDSFQREKTRTSELHIISADK